MAAKVISLINYKGGVGKTVSTFNIGFGLAFLNEQKVLLIDLDPQCSLSTICLNALGRTQHRKIDVSNLSEDSTINSVIKDYLLIGNNNPNIKINDVITKLPYTRHNGNLFHNVDFISATMFDSRQGTYEKGLDDLEIDIARNYSRHISAIELTTIFARFFLDTNLQNLYDYIIFDCPPVNNIITQNALAVSDYYLIPTIMDDMSSNGINHLKNIIEKSIFEELYNNNKRIIENSSSSSPYSYLKRTPKLLGIFETMRKTQVKYNNRKSIKDRFGKLLFDQIIYNHKPTADSSSQGISCFSVNINANRPQYSPHINYGNLVLEMLNRMGINKKNNGIAPNNWL